MLRIVYRTRPAPIDDRVAIRIVERTKVNLIPHEVQIGKIESKRFQNIARGHDISPVKLGFKLQIRHD
ncbi:hypothetical protein D3C84_1098280 [compost metagenome]